MNDKDYKVIYQRIPKECKVYTRTLDGILKLGYFTITAVYIKEWQTSFEIYFELGFFEFADKKYVKTNQIHKNGFEDEVQYVLTKIMAGKIEFMEDAYTRDEDGMIVEIYLDELVKEIYGTE